ncbi:hypothetical protein IJJ39_01835 [Candidatus Saccharibacteria bacterium]|nr:hypothetical protein [Candidatus Saccharibacteria bacterium]
MESGQELNLPNVEKKETREARDSGMSGGETGDGEMKTPSTAMMRPEKSGAKKGMIAGLVCLALLAVAGCAFGAYGMLTKDSEIAKVKAECAGVDTNVGSDDVVIDTTVATCEEGSTTVITEKANTEQEEVKKLATEVYDTFSEKFRGYPFFQVFSDDSLIKISEDGIYSNSNESYGVVSAESSTSEIKDDVMENAYTYAKEVLERNGFVKGESFMWYDAFSNNSSNITCSVNRDGLPFRMYCSKNSWISSVKKNLILELAKASDANYVNVSDNYQIKNSEISPYQTLTASGINYAMLFYRVSPDAEWQYFTGTQAILSCSEFTGDVAKAFAGTRCWDETTQSESTVQP